MSRCHRRHKGNIVAVEVRVEPQDNLPSHFHHLSILDRVFPPKARFIFGRTLVIYVPSGLEEDDICGQATDRVVLSVKNIVTGNKVHLWDPKIKKD
jgi:hypothetical protein